MSALPKSQRVGQLLRDSPHQWMAAAVGVACCLGDLDVWNEQNTKGAAVQNLRASKGPGDEKLGWSTVVLLTAQAAILYGSSRRLDMETSSAGDDLQVVYVDLDMEVGLSQHLLDLMGQLGRVRSKQLGQRQPAQLLCT